ncbi:hypothetical protein OAP18_03510, partial [Gammaproteobacteria bacterium]|nr:hypothetical protein [Gammaproteobacteria bacterium]
MLKRLTHYSFDWKLSLFTLALFPVLVKLGLWQLAREQEKLDLQEIYALRQGAPAQQLKELNQQDDLLYVQ